jgi:hypothetical protein
VLLVTVASPGQTKYVATLGCLRRKSVDYFGGFVAIGADYEVRSQTKILNQIRSLRRPVKQLAEQVETEVAHHPIYDDHGIKPRDRFAEPELLQPPLGPARTTSDLP